MNSAAQQVQSAPEAKPARFTITAVVDGFPVSIEVEGKAETLKMMIERLKAIGATPPEAQASGSTAKAGVPVCPVHGSRMKPSKKPGAYFCPRQTDNGEYCPEKA